MASEYTRESLRSNPFAASPDATFWSEADEVYVSVYVDDARHGVWDAYRTGLQECYESLGVAHIATDDIVRVDDCSLVWLIHDRNWTLVGGARAVGPFRDPGDAAAVPAATELAGGTDPDRFLGQLADLIADGGVVELKGGWSSRSVRGLGTVVGCFGWFCTWWFGVEHAIATAGSENNLRRWVETGAKRVDGFVPVAGYPAPQYDTEPMVWSRANLDGVPDRHQRFLQSATRQLHHARARARGLGGWAELVHRPERLAELGHQGVDLVDLTQPMRTQAAELNPPLGVGDAAGHPWIHYPWRNTAVRVLDEPSFHRVRTDRNRHKLTDAELADLRTKAVAIVGMSVGSSMAHTMAQEGLCGQLRIADHDQLELANLNRLSASLLDLAENKAVIAARRIAELDPYLELVVETGGVTSENVATFVHGADVVVEECDSLDVKVLVREAAAARGIPVVMETNDRGLLDIERFDLDPDRPLFHGLVDVPDSAALAELATEDKVPFVVDILDASEISARTAASMVEIDRTVSSWPQLGSEVALGAALAGQAVKTILLGRGPQQSGRVRVDLGELVATLSEPARPSRDPLVEEAIRQPLPDAFSDAVIRAAELAPSGGNAQPWQFQLGDDRFDVIECPDGLGMDVQARGTAVACGAALFNVACVAAAHGRLADAEQPVRPVLDLDRHELVGSVAFGDHHNSELAELAALIPDRVTNRRLDPSPTPIPESTLALLASKVAASGGRLIHVAGDELESITEIWAESDRLRFLDARLHREMFDELKDPAVDPVDVGLDARTLELTASDQAKLGILRRGDVMRELDQLDLGAQLQTDMRRRLSASSGLAVVVVPGQSRSDHVQGGVAMQRLWLDATRLGLGMQPVSPIFGYARSDTDLLSLVSPERVSAVRQLRDDAWSVLGIDAHESFILALRVHEAPPATAVSARRVASIRGSMAATT